MKEQNTFWDIGKFRVLMSSERKTSQAYMLVTKTAFKFNMVAACEMDYPEYVQMLISDDADRMVILPYDKKDRSSIPFYKEVMDRKTGKLKMPKEITVTYKAAVNNIRKKLDWSPEGQRCLAMRFTQEPNALFFDLTTAKPVTMLERLPKEETPLSAFPTFESVMDGLKPMTFALPPSDDVIDADYTIIDEKMGVSK